jgi:hypothetical protein
LPKNDNNLLKNDKVVPKSYSSAADTNPLNPRRLGKLPDLKRKNTMTPQVREIEQTPIAAPSTPAQATPVNEAQIVHIAKPAVEIKAPAPHSEAEQGKTSMLDKRRRRRARMSNRH